MCLVVDEHVARMQALSVQSTRKQEIARIVPDLILQRIAQGDRMAVQECIDRFGGLVWSLARRFCYEQSEAEDAVQEIFLDVWKSAARYDASVASEATFVALIARRRLIDRRRKSGREPSKQELAQDFEQATTAPVESMAIAEDAASAVKALETLRPEQQRVLRLSIYQGMSHEKIAEATGLPLGTVKTHVRRGLIRIREILQGGAPAAEGAQA